MGNISFLDVNSWRYADGNDVSDPSNVDVGYGIIEIFPSSLNSNKTSWPRIKGVLKDSLSLSFDSEWVAMDSIDIPFVSDTINKAGEVIGSGTMLAGGGDWMYIWKSQKVWKQSGYIKVSGTFTVVDWNGDGSPLTMARNIIKYCTPGGNSKSMALSKEANEKLLAATSAVSNATGSNVSTAVGNNIAGMTDMIAIKDAPPIVTIRVSKYFEHEDMVINSVSTKFSKEVSERGPLSVEITFDAESRSKTSGFYKHWDATKGATGNEKDDIGLKGQYGSRVKQGPVG